MGPSPIEMGTGITHIHTSHQQQQQQQHKRSLAPVAQATPHLSHPNPNPRRRKNNFNKEQRDSQVERELQRERERQRENEIRAFREFSTKLPEKLQQRNKYGQIYNHIDVQEPRQKERRGNPHREKATPTGYVDVHASNHRYMGTLEHLENVPPIDPQLFAMGAAGLSGRQPLPDRANFPKSRGNLGLHPLAGEGGGEGEQRFADSGTSGRGLPAKQGRGSLHQGMHALAAPMASEHGYAHPPYPRGYDYEW